ncbi:MAG: (2Fe-2S) ferredoxin domain-containing protein, partial [Burkholderiales bacterium]|nr:(2Fe-2S) ferredoxin domain-containing protein [Burkholderiales bacterium]
MSYYERHVFFCTNRRDPPEKCCADAGAADMQAYCKGRVKEL